MTKVTKSSVVYVMDAGLPKSRKWGTEGKRLRTTALDPSSKSLYIINIAIENVMICVMNNGSRYPLPPHSPVNNRMLTSGKLPQVSHYRCEILAYLVLPESFLAS